MAKGAYVGVDGVARRIKRGYVGVLTDVPIYEEQTGTTNITENNIEEFFEVYTGSYSFVGSNGTFTSNNIGVNSSTALIELTALVDMTLSFDYSYSTEDSFDKFTLIAAGTIVENAVSGSTTNKSWSGSVTAGQIIEFKYTKDSSSSDNDDKCTFSNMVATATRQVQIGSESKEVARRIKMAYVGVGGVARPCWPTGEPVYYGSITALRTAKGYPAATTIGDYALFAGGTTVDSFNGSGNNAEVDVYNASLTRTTATNLYYNRRSMAATSNGNHAIFFSGQGGGLSPYADAYDTNLTRTADIRLNTGWSCAATSINGYAIVGGGTSPSGEIAYVQVFDSELTVSSIDNLYKTVSGLAATSVGNYALFGGGEAGTSSYSYVNAYRGDTLTKYGSYLSSGLSKSRAGLSAATVGNNAIFAGGYQGILTNATPVNTVDVFNNRLVRTIATGLQTASFHLAATTLGDYAIFGGGCTDNTNFDSPTSTNSVTCYDKTMTRTISTPLSEARLGLAATSIGDYALFGGGLSPTSTVEAYTI